ncbi:MAG: hypothetical protein JXD22_15065 [Sedimentisphaerales bacterium]|nr:hypothetical protein [Sedimentisphaerales bacterium]
MDAINMRAGTTITFEMEALTDHCHIYWNEDVKQYVAKSVTTGLVQEGDDYQSAYIYLIVHIACEWKLCIDTDPNREMARRELNTDVKKQIEKLRNNKNIQRIEISEQKLLLTKAKQIIAEMAFNRDSPYFSATPYDTGLAVSMAS